MGKSPLLELLIFSILRRRLAGFEFLKMCFRGFPLLISPNHLRSPSTPPDALDLPDLQIRLLSGEAYALLLLIGFQRVHRESKPPSLSPSRLVNPKIRHLCYGEREQCFKTFLNQTSPTNLSWNRATEALHQSNDTFGQTSEQYFDDTSNDYRSGPTMDVVTIPLPPSSTLNPAPPSPARRFMTSTMTPANPPCLTLPSTRTLASTPLPDPSTTLPRGYRSSPILTTLMPQPPAMPPLTSTSSSPPTSRHLHNFIDQTKGKLGFLSLGLSHFGPCGFSFWPIFKSGNHYKKFVYL